MLIGIIAAFREEKKGVIHHQRDQTALIFRKPSCAGIIFMLAIGTCTKNGLHLRIIVQIHDEGGSVLLDLWIIKSCFAARTKAYAIPFGKKF